MEEDSGAKNAVGEKRPGESKLSTTLQARGYVHSVYGSVGEYADDGIHKLL